MTVLGPPSYDLKKCIMYLVDGTPTAPNKLEVRFDEGNLTYVEKTNYEYRRNRGKLDEVREGDEEPLEVTFDGRFNALVSASGESITIAEFLRQRGAGADLVSTGAACAPYAVDIILEVYHDCGTMLDEVITFGEFRADQLSGNFKDGTISVQGKCNKVAPTAIRTEIAT